MGERIRERVEEKREDGGERRGGVNDAGLVTYTCRGTHHRDKL
jgi:hypothetical protein